jgi:hypothetical protein
VLVLLVVVLVLLVVVLVLLVVAVVLVVVDARVLEGGVLVVLGRAVDAGAVGAGGVERAGVVRGSVPGAVDATSLVGMATGVASEHPASVVRLTSAATVVLIPRLSMPVA